MGLENQGSSNGTTTTSYQPNFFPQGAIAQGGPVPSAPIEPPHPVVENSAQVTVKNLKNYITNLKDAILKKLEDYILYRSNAYLKQSYDKGHNFTLYGKSYLLRETLDTLTWNRVKTTIHFANIINDTFEQVLNNAPETEVLILLENVEKSLHCAIRGENLHSQSSGKNQYISKVYSNGFAFFPEGTCKSLEAIAECFKLTAFARKELLLPEQKERSHAIPNRSSSCTML